MRRALCLSLFCCCLALDGTAAAETPPEVTVSQPVVREVTDYGDFMGRAEAVQSVTICPRVSGQLTRMVFKAGGAVRQGDILFEIDPRRYEADLERQKAEMQLAAARLEPVAAQLKRIKKLAATAAVSNEEVERSEAALLEAEAGVKAAQAKVNSARLELDFTKVLAPISGKIGLPAVDVGNVVTADTTWLTTIVSTDPVYVFFDIDERTALQLRRKAQESPGKIAGNSDLPVSCGLVDEAGFPRRGEVDAANNRVDPGTGTLRMRAVTQNPGGLIMPGMSVRVRLVMSEPYKAVLVPERALMSDQGNKQVFVVTAANVIERRGVKLGPLQDGLRVVKEGLAASENVVVRPGPRLRPGMTVTVKKAESPERH